MTETADETKALINQLADAAKAFAEAEKTRAEADKQRADTDKVRADIEAEKRLAQNKLDVAAEDLEGKRIANRLARDQASAAHTDKLIERLTGAVPDLGSVGKSTVSFREGAALRQGESVSLALGTVADEIAGAVAGVMKGRPGNEVFVVTDPGLVAALAAYRQLDGEATLLRQRIDDAIEEAKEATAAATAPIRTETREIAAVLGAEAGIVAAAVAGKAITQLASLFEIDVDASTSATDIPASTVHAAVIGRILATDGAPRVRHEWARVPSTASALLATIPRLTELDIDATTVGARLDAAAKELGDPAGDLATLRKDAKENPGENPARDQAITKAEQELQRLNRVQRAGTDLTALLEKARAFAERVTKAADDGGPGALARAVSVEPLATAEGLHVLVLGGAKAETYQTVVKRRVFYPRVQVSTSVEVDYLLIEGEHVVLAGHATSSAAYAGVIRGRGPRWRRMKAMAELES